MLALGRVVDGRSQAIATALALRLASVTRTPLADLLILQMSWRSSTYQLIATGNLVAVLLVAWSVIGATGVGGRPAAWRSIGRVGRPRRQARHRCWARAKCSTR
jgi:hypothetical protein